MREFLRHGWEGRTFKGTFLFYIAHLIPLLIIALPFRLVVSSEETFGAYVIDICLAGFMMSASRVYAYWPEIDQVNKKLNVWANDHPGLFMGFLSGISSLVGIGMGLYWGITPLVTFFTIWGLVGFLFALLSNERGSE